MFCEKETRNARNMRGINLSATQYTPMNPDDNNVQVGAYSAYPEEQG
jgi:hypothetical protein